MSTKILAIGDLHSKVSNQEDIKACADKNAEQIKEKQPNAIVIMGDLANDHERSHVLAFNGIVLFFDIVCAAAADIGRKVYYLIGNHDLMNNQQFLTDNHFFNAFKKWPNLVIVDRPIRLKAENGYVLLCPYVPPGRFEEAIRPTMPPDTDSVLAIMCHQEFLGAKLGAIPSKVGDRYPEDSPLVISGHIHNYDRLQKNIVYVGSPMDHTFGEDSEKTISLFEFESPSEWTESRTNLGLPRKITITLDMTKASTFDPPDGAYIRLNLVGTAEEHTLFKTTEQYKKLNKLTKIIPKIVDSSVVKRNLERKGYLELLRKECETADSSVQEALQEIFDENIFN